MITVLKLHINILNKMCVLFKIYDYINFQPTTTDDVRALLSMSGVYSSTYLDLHMTLAYKYQINKKSNLQDSSYQRWIEFSVPNIEHFIFSEVNKC
jgi:hypothetical protein